MHNRKLFPYKQLYCLTRETRHPNRHKRWKVYSWLNYTLHNRWNYGMRIKKNYRLRQLLLGRIISPYLNALKQKQFIQIKKRSFNIKPLALTNSRPSYFLGKFERRIDILTYKLNFAPTIQWARFFVEAGWIYVSYWTNIRNSNFTRQLHKYQKFPLLPILELYTKKNSCFTLRSFSLQDKITTLSAKLINTPLPITLPSYRILLKGIVHWTNPNIKTWFYKKLFKRHLPKYFIFNKAQTICYFWRNLTHQDIVRLKRHRIKKNTFNWLT